MGTGKSTEYFPHDCNAKDDPKIMLMMAQLGLEAYGIYWILVEYLRSQPGFKAPLILLDPLSRRFGSSREKFEAIVKNFNLFEYDNISFFSPSLIRRMEPLEKMREQQRIRISKRWEKTATTTTLSIDKQNITAVIPRYNHGNTAVIPSKEEKRRVKKSKVKKSKEENITVLSPELIENQNQLLVKKWYEWCDFRKALKKPYKTTTGAAAAYNKLLTLSQNNSDIALSIIKQSIENEWLGFFPLKTTRGIVTIPGEDPVDKIIREAHEFMKNKQTSNTDGI
jgi:hypothetical protein